MSRNHRVRGLVLLLALVGLQLTTLGAALAGEDSCLCDEQVCSHHPGKHGSHSHDHAAPAPPAPRVEAPAAEHCAHHAAGTAATTAAPRDCSMRGCDHQRDDSLPVAPLASLPDPTSIALPEGVSALAVVATVPPLDRSSNVEPPPPRFLSV